MIQTTYQKWKTTITYHSMNTKGIQCYFAKSIKYLLHFPLTAVLCIVTFKYIHKNSVILHRSTNELASYNYIMHANDSFYSLNNLPFLLESEVKWVTVNFLWTKVPCTLVRPYTEGTWLYCDYFIWCVSWTVVVLTGFVMFGCLYVWVL